MYIYQGKNTSESRFSMTQEKRAPSLINRSGEDNHFPGDSSHYAIPAVSHSQITNELKSNKFTPTRFPQILVQGMRKDRAVGGLKHIFYQESIGRVLNLLFVYLRTHTVFIFFLSLFSYPEILLLFYILYQFFFNAVFFPVHLVDSALRPPESSFCVLKTLVMSINLFNLSRKGLQIGIKIADELLPIFFQKVIKKPAKEIKTRTKTILTYFCSIAGNNSDIYETGTSTCFVYMSKQSHHVNNNNLSNVFEKGAEELPNNATYAETPNAQKKINQTDTITPARSQIIRSNSSINSIISWSFIILLFSSIILVEGGKKDKEKMKMVKIDGDVIFGGMFPMHERGGDVPCGTIKEEKGIQRMEAMLYAMDRINEDKELLPNITIGAMILDTCSSDTYALEQSMEFFRASLSQDVSAFKCEKGKEPIYDPPKPVVGVIGAASSSVSVMVANILRLFKIPQVSYASTSTELSDKTRFDYFSRVVPPDNFQAQAMVEVIKVLGWQYVSTLAVEGGYGEKGIASFIKLAQASGICIAVSERIKRLMSKPEEFDELIDILSSKPQARVIVMFVDEDNTRKVLTAAKKANKTGQFLWIGSDSWGAKIHPVRDQEEVARGAITILPKRASLLGFDRHIRSLRPKMRKIRCSEPHPDPMLYRNCRNVWFKEFWTHHFNCTFREHVPPGRKNCSGEEHISTEQEGLVPFVVDAVYALAHAYHDLVLDSCGDMYLCEEVSPVPPGELLLQYIRNVTFVGQQGTEVKFNADGDAPGSYFIFQYQKIGPNSYDYVHIGNWTESLELNMSKLFWTTEQLNNNETNRPLSICSDPCPTGQVRNFQDACCWSCVPCPIDSKVYNDTCQACDLGWAPTPDKISCYKLTPEYIIWNSIWAIVPIVFSSFGLLFTLLTTITFIRFNKTPIIMASGRELCYVLLLGIASCYLMTFVVLAPPSKPTCTLMRIGLGLGLCICYSAIFTKTNRISRIFNRGVKSIKRPNYTSPRSQILICIGLVGVQLIGITAWLLVEIPDTKEIYPRPLVAVLTCGISNVSFIVSLGYNMILIILCTVYAFKTRKIPENFNEAKYIGFTMYSTCIVWLAFIPIYFGTLNDYKVQLASLCMCVSISASVALGCLFTPKIYIVLFQPYKNVRQGSNQAKCSSAGKNYGTSLKFAPRSQTAQSVLSTNHSSCPAPPPTTISQHVNGESMNVRSPPKNAQPSSHPNLGKGSVT